LIFDLAGLPQTKKSLEVWENLSKNEKDKKQILKGIWFANLFEGRAENLEIVLENGEKLSDEIFKTISVQEAFSYLEVKTSHNVKKKAKLLQSDLFKGCHLDTANLKTFIFAIHYENNKKIKQLELEIKKKESKINSGKTDTGTGKTDTGKKDTGKTDTGTTDTGKTDTGNEAPQRTFYTTTIPARWLNDQLNRANNWMLKDQSWWSFALTLGNTLHPAKLLLMVNVAVNIATVVGELFISVGLIFAGIARLLLILPVKFIPSLKNGKLSDFVWKNWNWSTTGHLMNAGAYTAAAATDFATLLFTYSWMMKTNNKVKQRLGIIPVESAK
jgi:hypothetical protein